MARRTPGLLALLLLAAGSGVTAQELRLAQVPVSGRAGLDSLARLGFEVADVRTAAGQLTAVIVVSAQTERLLGSRGFAVAAVAGAPSGLAADTFKVFRSFDKPSTGIRATLAAWAAADTLIHVDSIGASIEGRPILAVKIGDPGDSPARPNVLFMGTHHAREWVSTEVAMRLIRWLADSLPRPLLASPRHLGDPRRKPRRLSVHVHDQPVMAEEPPSQRRRQLRRGPQSQLPRLLGG
jgi:hypothetical protein